MERFVNNLKEKLNEDIQVIESSEPDIFNKSAGIVKVLEKAFEELKPFIDGYTIDIMLV
jgi:hypothetical protein